MTGPVLDIAAPADDPDLLQRLWAVVGSVPDPEIPVLTLSDLGIVRDVLITADSTVVVTLTPTYTGCPATAVIAFSATRGSPLSASSGRATK